MPKILMCPPQFFDVNYSINAWMDTSNKVDVDLAKQQWNVLYNGINDLEETIFMNPEENLPDLVFTANSGIVHKNIFIPSNFKYPERQGETKHFEFFFLKQGFNILKLPLAYNFEGAGDMLRYSDNETYFGGYGFRTDLESYDFLGKILGVEIFKLNLINPYFYHLDTALCPVSKNLVVYYPGAFSEESRTLIESKADTIVVPENEAMKFACNMVAIENNILMPSGCPETRIMLKDSGFTVQEFDMSEFQKSGGACKCLTFEMNDNPAAKINWLR